MSTIVKGKDRALVCVVEGDELIIRIGVDTLAFADQERRNYERGSAYKVTDTVGFAMDVAVALLREDEIGATMLTNLLDQAMDDAIGRGSAYVEEVAST